MPLYNMAVIYYHRHMYQTAIDTLKPVVDKIETYDSNIMAMVGVLMLRLLLATNQPRKAYFFLEEVLGHLSINITTMAADEGNIQESAPRLEEKFNKHLKLLSLLTHLVNRKIVQVPEDGVSSMNFIWKIYIYLCYSPQNLQPLRHTNITL